MVPRIVYNPMEEAPKVYRVTEVPKGNIPADELLYRVLEPGPLSCDRDSDPGQPSYSLPRPRASKGWWARWADGASQSPSPLTP